MKNLGFGTMRLPLLNKEDPTSIDIEQFKNMVDLFIKEGFTYFDTAWMYHSYKSEEACKEALTKRYPRDAYTLTTKLHVHYLKCKEDADKIFNEQLEKTGVTYFDYYLLHSFTEKNYPLYEEYDLFNWLVNKKKEGLVKHIGFSYHSNAKLLDEILTKHPEIEFVQLQLNYLDWESNSVQSRLNYEVCVKHNKKILVMEPIKGGKLANPPKEVYDDIKSKSDLSVASWAVRFAASLDNVFMVLSGMSNLDQMKDNISYMKEFKPLTKDEHLYLLKKAEEIRKLTKIPCTGCEYCVPGCSMKINIPKIFDIDNREGSESEFNELIKTSGKPSSCIKCGQCESVCPQHIKIIETLHKISQQYE